MGRLMVPIPPIVSVADFGGSLGTRLAAYSGIAV